METADRCSPLPMGRVKGVLPLGTRVAVADRVPDVIVRVPERSETAASMRAVTDASWWPLAIGRSTRSSTEEEQMDATVPAMLPGVQTREVTDREQISPVTEGRGWGSSAPSRLRAPASPSSSCQETVTDGNSPLRGRSQETRWPVVRLEAARKTSVSPSSPP